MRGIVSFICVITITQEFPYVFDKWQIGGNNGTENLLTEPTFFQLGKRRISMWFIEDNPEKASGDN